MRSRSAFGLFTLSAPAALPASDAESVAVEIVPMEAIAQIQQGDKKAVMHRKAGAAADPASGHRSRRQKTFGDNSVDTDKPPTPEPKPKPVDMAVAPPPAPTPK